MTTERDIGILEGKMGALEKSHDDFQESVERRLTAIEGYVQEIRDAANMGKGMWWITLKFGAMVTTAAMSLLWIWSQIKAYVTIKVGP